jgi:chemotaxis protein MotB
MGGAGFFDSNSNQFPIDGGKGVSEGNKDSGDMIDNKNEKEDDRPEMTDEQIEEQERIKEIQARINAYVTEHGLEEAFVSNLTIEGLSITIRDNVLFDSGKADVRPENVETAREISKLLEMDVPRSIIISGHTDNIPMNNWEFSSNWDLSVMRAVNFMEILLENQNLNPMLFSAKGYGEYQPVAPNDTVENRAKNRRVEIMILPRTSSKVN